MGRNTQRARLSNVGTGALEGARSREHSAPCSQVGSEDPGPKLGGLLHAAVVSVLPCHEKAIFAELCKSVYAVGMRGSQMPGLNRWVLIRSSCAGRASPPLRTVTKAMGRQVGG